MSARPARGHLRRAARQPDELARLKQSVGGGRHSRPESARAEMAEQSRRWAVAETRVAAGHSGLERRRAERKDPLLARAGAFFSDLTEGRYAGLDQGSATTTACISSARAPTARAGAVRLERGRARPALFSPCGCFSGGLRGAVRSPPFIGDDLFASFDDSRVAAGLKALAAASATIQPILFTHHAHIVAIAERFLARGRRSCASIRRRPN